jgi:hypothetical protein
MTTVAEAVKDIQSLAPKEAFQPAAVAKWLNNRYVELVARVRFRHLRNLGELSLPAVLSTGTASATRGSTSVTGTDTTWQTDIGAGTQTQYYFRTLTSWYKIASIDGETSLTLASEFAESNVSGGAYEIVKRFHSLASSARWIQTVVFPRLRYKLIGPITDYEFDSLFPGRLLAGNHPQAFRHAGVDSDGYIQVEVYPPPATTELLGYTYYSIPTALALGTTIPPQIDAYVLKEGALIDLYRALKIIQIEKGNIDAAAVYSNSEAKQITYWEKKIREATHTQRGADDITFILENFGGARRTGEIRTARDQIFANWSH